MRWCVLQTIEQWPTGRYRQAMTSELLSAVVSLPGSEAPAEARRRGRPPHDVAVQRERILSAACRLFIERGFAECSVEAIGRAAGVTKRTIYELIGDKEALFRAVCTKLCANAASFNFDAAVTERPVRDILLDMAATILKFALEPQGLAFSRLLAVESMRFPGLVVTVMDEGRNALHEKMASIFADLAVRGKLAPVNPSRAADCFYDTIIGSRAMRAMLGYNEPYPAADEIEQRVDMLLRGLLLGA